MISTSIRSLLCLGVTIALFLGCTEIMHSSYARIGSAVLTSCSSSCNSMDVSNENIKSGKDNRGMIHLPSFENGGIIFFLHIPKTGGVCVRKTLQNGKSQYMLSDTGRKFEPFKRLVDQYVQYGTTNKEVVVFELHAFNSPTMLQVSEQLQTWRMTANKNNVAFFAFTILREPISFSISYFNFYHGMDHHDSQRFQYYENPSEQDFIDTAPFNPQCGFLAKGDRIFFQRKRQQMLQRSDCEIVYQTLVENMDWIGTTDRLSNETFPVLKLLIGSNTNADHIENIPKIHQTPTKIALSDLSAKTIRRIHKMTLWDQDLYENVTNLFSFVRVQMVERRNDSG